MQSRTVKYPSFVFYKQSTSGESGDIFCFFKRRPSGETTAEVCRTLSLNRNCGVKNGNLRKLSEVCQNAGGDRFEGEETNDNFLDCTCKCPKDSPSFNVETNKCRSVMDPTGGREWNLASLALPLGLALGAVVILTILVILFCYFRRRSKPKLRTNRASENGYLDFLRRTSWKRPTDSMIFHQTQMQPQIPRTLRMDPDEDTSYQSSSFYSSLPDGTSRRSPDKLLEGPERSARINEDYVDPIDNRIGSRVKVQRNESDLSSNYHYPSNPLPRETEYQSVYAETIERQSTKEASRRMTMIEEPPEDTDDDYIVCNVENVNQMPEGVESLYEPISPRLIEGESQSAEAGEKDNDYESYEKPLPHSAVKNKKTGYESLKLNNSSGNREETQASAPSTDERTSPSLPAAGTLDYSRANDLYLDFQQLEDLQPQEKKELSDISSAEPEAKDALKSETSKANDDPVYHVLSRENLA